MVSKSVQVINHSTVLSDTAVSQAMASLQSQVHDDFAPVWGADADLSFVARHEHPDPAAWWLVILDNTDQAQALGYHDLTTTGLPLGKVFANSDIQAHLQWTVTASHELLEMLGDPYIDLSVFVQSDKRAGTLYAYEVCDACEDESYSYDINGTKVSDFVYPAWFQSQNKNAQYDHLGSIHAPFELLPGGYIGTYDITAGQGWNQVTAQGTAPLYSMRPPIGSRRERRRTPKSQWILSAVETTG